MQMYIKKIRKEDLRRKKEGKFHYFEEKYYFCSHKHLLLLHGTFS